MRSRQNLSHLIISDDVLTELGPLLLVGSHRKEGHEDGKMIREICYVSSDGTRKSILCHFLGGMHKVSTMT